MDNAELIGRLGELISSPESIDVVREYVLGLGSRGRLVPRDPSEGTAHDWLSQLPHTPLGLDDARLVPPYSIPPHWQWVRLGDLAEYAAGRTPPRHDPTFWNNGDYPWVSIADMQHGASVLTTKETVSERAKSRVFGSEPVPPGTILMSFKLTIGKISRLGIPAFHNEAIISVRPFLRDMDAYLFAFLPQAARQGRPRMP